MLRRRGTSQQPIPTEHQRETYNDNDNIQSISYRAFKRNRSTLLTLLSTGSFCYLVWTLGGSLCRHLGYLPQGNSNRLRLNDPIKQQDNGVISANLIPRVENSIVVADEYEDGAPLVIGTHHRFLKNTTDVVYAFPPADVEELGVGKTDRQKKVQIALLIHACTHSALKFFSPSPSCPDCIGLSEEIRIARILLSRRYVVVAISSSNRKSGCWNDNEVHRVNDILIEFQQLVLNDEYGEEQVQHASVISIGASSGGHFAAALAVNGIATGGSLIMVSRIGPKLVEKFISSIKAYEKEYDEAGGDSLSDSIISPIYLAPMPRDTGTTKGAQTDYDTILQSSSKSAIVERLRRRIILDVSTCTPLEISVAYLNERVPHMTASMATMIIKALAKAKHVVPSRSPTNPSNPSGNNLSDDNIQQSNFSLIKDPTRSDWRQVLQESCANQGCLTNQPLGPGVSPLAKGLHRAWAYHEYCSEVVEPALDFFASSLDGMEV